MLFARFSINLKLLFLTALPLLLLSLLLFRESTNLYSIQKHNYQTTLIIEFVSRLAHIAHQHALERGLTARFLGSNGSKGKNKMLQQRKKSDQSVDALKHFINTHHRDLKNINANVDKLLDLLKLKKLGRAKIDKLISDHDAFGYYSSVNKEVTDTINRLTIFVKYNIPRTIGLLSVFVGKNTLNHNLNSMVEIIRLKEHASQSRGALHGVYEKKTATVELYTNAYTYINNFDTTLELLINNSHFHTKAAIVKLSKMVFFTQVSIIENNFLNQSNQLDNVQGPLAGRWFALGTRRIDVINDIFNEQKSYIANESQRLFAESQRYLILGIIIMIALILALIFLSYSIALNISSRIHNINNMLTYNINHNDLTVKIKEYGDDEIDYIAKGISRYINQVKDVFNRIEEISSERKYLANHDPLTKLANRSLFFSRLIYLAEPLNCYARHHAILYIDLDLFKKINDQYGHAVGDKVLEEFAKTLVRQVRTTDTVSRLGGDEFAIILEDITSENACSISQKLLKVMKTPLLVDNLNISISITIGMTFFPQEIYQNPTELLKQADQALYSAKQSGRQQYRCFDKTLQKVYEENKQFEDDLKDAIKNQEIVPHFQPQYCLQTQTMVGLEALARWKHPEKGFIPPNKFIPIAEKLSLMTLLTESMMTQAVTHLLSFIAIEPKLKIAINISASDCLNPYIAQLTKKLIKENHLKPEQIEFEITESVLIEQPDLSIEMLTELHNLGISIAIDDFGTEYSSLSYLTALPIDVLKIDQSFIQGIGLNPQQEIVIEFIIDLAKRLSLSVLAEGIETQTQADFLIENGCNYVQGYFYSKPCSAKDIIKLLEESRAN